MVAPRSPKDWTSPRTPNPLLRRCSGRSRATTVASPVSAKPMPRPQSTKPISRMGHRCCSQGNTHPRSEHRRRCPPHRPVASLPWRHERHHAPHAQTTCRRRFLRRQYRSMAARRTLYGIAHAPERTTHRGVPARYVAGDWPEHPGRDVGPRLDHRPSRRVEQQCGRWRFLDGRRHLYRAGRDRPLRGSRRRRRVDT